MGIKYLAYYLPQYHPVAENDQWWGKGFTEWTNLAKAKPFYKGHLQPKLPADLGFYDLRIPEVREAQAQMAKQHGLSGFCYYHYWFGGKKQLLQHPASEILKLQTPDFPFCFCWANQSWTGHWFGADKKMLMEQTYPGDGDIEDHFAYLLPFFKDPRYIKINNKPLFKILDIKHLPNPKQMAEKLKSLAVQNGLDGLYLVAGNFYFDDWNPLENSFDALTDNTFNRSLSKALNSRATLWKRVLFNRYTKKILGDASFFYQRRTVSMKDFVTAYQIPESNFPKFPIVTPNWDNTPRSLENGLVIRNDTPECFIQQLQAASGFATRNSTVPVVFIKSWNEWAEGNYLEPDVQNGFTYLESLKKYIEESKIQ